MARLAADKIEPLVRKMEKEGQFDPSVVQVLFENGVRPVLYVDIFIFHKHFHISRKILL